MRLGEKGVSARLKGPGSSLSPTLSPGTTARRPVIPDIIMANELSNSLVSPTRSESGLGSGGGRPPQRDDLQMGRPGEPPWPTRP